MGPSEQNRSGEILNAHADHSGERSADLSVRLEMPQEGFERRVRQLNDLGLTESLGTGCRLSPRGTDLHEGR